MGLTLVTGGARSGKSTFAEKLASNYAALDGRDKSVLYIATAIPYDDEMRERIKRHQADRPKEWRTVEAYQNLDQVFNDARESVILLDCLTVMVTNLLFAAGINEEHPTTAEVNHLEAQVMAEVTAMLRAVQGLKEKDVIMVTNEVGMGLVPPYPLGRIFRDLAGRVNQRVAGESEQVYLLVSGIPVQIKGGVGQ